MTKEQLQDQLQNIVHRLSMIQRIGKEIISDVYALKNDVLVFKMPEGKSVEDMLEEYHFKKFPSLTKDNIENHLDAWLSNLDVQEVIDILSKYNKE